MIRNKEEDGNDGDDRERQQKVMIMLCQKEKRKGTDEKMEKDASSGCEMVIL